MLRLVLLIAAALAVAFAISFVLGRRGVFVAAAAFVVGAASGILSTIITACNQCWTEALSVGAFVSMPFFVVGWFALAQAEVERRHRRLLLGLGALMLVQVIWAARMTVLATFQGVCPCGAQLWWLRTSEIASVGFDRLAGPWFMLEAVMTLAVLFSAGRRLVEDAPAR